MFAGKLKGLGFRRSGDPDAIFATEHLKKNLGSRTAKGGIVVFVSQLIKFLSQMGSQVVLARLLLPADFGLIAMVAAFSGFLFLFQDMGLTIATVQRKEISHKQVSMLFWINMLVGFTIMSVFAGISPLIAWLYSEPELIGITLAMSLTFPLAGLSAQHFAIMRRQMRYRAIASIEIAAMAGAAIVAIVLAWLGFGYWALVGMMLSQPGIKTVLAWVFSPWLPGFFIRVDDMGGLLKFGGNITASNVFSYFTRNADNIMLGAVWGPATLGFYSRAYSMLLLPMKQINAPIASVAMPSLSRLQDEPDRFESFYCRMLQVAAYISMPIVMLLIILSEEAVLVLLGEDWMKSVPIFRALSILAFFQTVQNSTGWVMLAYDRTGRMFKWGFVQGSFAVMAFAIGLNWGGYGVAVAAAICGTTLVLPALLYAYHDTPVRIGSVLKVLIRPLCLSAVVLVSALPARYWLDDYHLVLRIAGPLAASGIAVALTVLCWKQLREDLVNIKKVLKKK